MLEFKCDLCEEMTPHDELEPITNIGFVCDFCIEASECCGACEECCCG